jgi:hypothetical protein
VGYPKLDTQGRPVPEKRAEIRVGRAGSHLGNLRCVLREVEDRCILGNYAVLPRFSRQSVYGAVCTQN